MPGLVSAPSAKAALTLATLGDFDGDTDVDLKDFGHFQACLSGTGVAADPGCEDADLQGDGAVDEVDFSIFEGCLGGADAPPGC